MNISLIFTPYSPKLTPLFHNFKCVMVMCVFTVKEQCLNYERFEIERKKCGVCNGTYRLQHLEREKEDIKKTWLCGDLHERDTLSV